VLRAKASLVIRIHPVLLVKVRAKFGFGDLQEVARIVEALARIQKQDRFSIKSTA